MQKIKSKTMAILITLLLTFSMTASMTLLPSASAHTPPLTIATSAYVIANTNPEGVNQTTSLTMWLNYIPPTATGQYGDRWHGFTVKITKPDGTNQTLGPFTSDPAGTYTVQYTPDQVGNYTIVFSFPGQVLAGANPPPPSIITSSQVGFAIAAGDAYINDTFSASTSEPLTLVVQQQPVNHAWPAAPLPTSYWTTPITALNAQWYTIAGNWLAGSGEYGGTTSGYAGTSLGDIAPYSTAPETSHILWTKPLLEGGVADGALGAEEYWNGEPYQPADLSPPIIINGVLYYNVMTEPKEGWYAVDLRTGQEQYYVNETGPVQLAAASAGGDALPNNLPQLSFGQILAFNAMNEKGAHPYVWSAYTTQYVTIPGLGPIAVNTTWAMYDAFSGNWICNIDNVPAGGTTVTGSDGSILKYFISGTGANERLLVWNTTQAIWWQGTEQMYLTGNYSAFGGGGYYGWLPQIGVTFNGNNGYSTNVSIPAVQGSILSVSAGVDIIGGTSGSNNGTGPVVPGTMWALNLNPTEGPIGSLLWKYTFTPPVNLAPQGSTGVGIFLFGGLSGPTVYPNDGVFLFEQGETADCWYCYNLTNGQLMWTSAQEGDSWSSYGLSGIIYNGELYSYGLDFGYSGNIYCIDLQTGKTLWDYASGQTSSVIGFPNTPIAIVGAANGIIYVCGTDTFPTNPYPQGYDLYALNATTGNVIWQIPFYVSGLSPPKIAIADGDLVAANSYDNQIYCFGKGPSATTVTTAPGINTNTQVLIKGAVTDQSSGQTCLGIPAAGTPAISDASMSQWMEYLYMQQPEPMNATGVPVTLTYTDPNGNTYTMGTTTSNIAGQYSYKFTPTVPGTYTIIATFCGSNSYFSSTAQTTMLWNTPAVTAAPTSTPTTVADMYFVPAIAGLFVLIIIVAIVLALLMLRKKP